MAARQRYGFTLLELIVVLIIIAGLATLGIQQYQNMVWKARFAEVYQTVGILVRAQRIYYMMHGQYTLTDSSTSNHALGRGIPAGSTEIQKQLGVSMPENSLFLYSVYPTFISPAETRVYFYQRPGTYTWCYAYDYVAKTWTKNGSGDPGPSCNYFTPPASAY